MPIEVSSEPKLILHLVHGTRVLTLDPKRWIKENSSFRNALSKELEKIGIAHRYQPFCWSGKNSIVERNNAATRLSEAVTRGIEEFPESRHVIIAHSHGGNISMQCNNLLSEKRKYVHIISLATPFTYFYEKIKEGDRDTVYDNISLSIFCPIYYILLKITFSYLPFNIITALLSVIFDLELFVFFLVTVLSLFLSYFLVELIADPWSDSSCFQYKRWDKILPRRYVLSSSEIKMLVLRGVDDEAGFFLAAGAIGAWLARIFMWIGTQHWTRWAFLLPLIAIGSASFGAWHDWVSSSGPSDISKNFPDMFFLIKPLSILGIVVFILTFLVVLFKSFAGRELWHGSARVEIAINSVPDCESKIWVETLPSNNITLAKLNHKLYNHPSCAGIIVRWLTESGLLR